MKLLLKLTKILAITILILTGLTLFIWIGGIQYTIAILSFHSNNPYFNITTFETTPNYAGSPTCDSGPIRVMTYNVLCRICDKDDYDKWEQRLPHLRATIERYTPDLLGLQELGGNDDIHVFLDMFPQFKCITYQFGPWAYADAALFYRADRFEALDSGQMWLNPKPALPFGYAWKPLSMFRYVNWVYLRQKNNDFRFLYINTHFDNNSSNKDPSAILFAETFRPLAAKIPIIATGDFNTDTTVERYQNIKKGRSGIPVFTDAMELTPKQELINNIGPGKKPEELAEFIELPKTIDHIFLAGPGKWEVTRWIQDASVYPPNNRWPSDHPSVFAEINLRNNTR